MSNWDKVHEYFNFNDKLEEENEKKLIKTSLKDDFIKKWYLDREAKLKDKTKDKTKLEQWREKFRIKDLGYECDIQTREVLFEKHNLKIDNVIRQKIAFNQKKIKCRNLMKGYVSHMSEPKTLGFDFCFRPTVLINTDVIKSEYENPMVEFIDLCDFFS